MNMPEKWLHWEQRFDALSQRERLLMLGIALALTIALLEMTLINPLLASQDRARAQLATLSADLEKLQQRAMILDAELAAGVNRAREQRARTLEAQVAKLDERIERSLIAMIPPRLMTEVLENVLLQDGELTLLSLENLPVEAIVSRATADPGTEPANGEDGGLYRHSFVLTLTGNYPATVRYFEALAQLPWQFHWDGLRYQVQTYPEAIITLQVHTVSMSRDWIGV